VTFFVDANVLVYAAGANPYRRGCETILEAVASGEADGRTSPAVLEEVWHLERSGRVDGISGLTERGYRVFTPLLPVTDEAFRLALAIRASRLGPADRLHAGTCLEHGIDTIVSADTSLSSVRTIRRVDPSDERAVRRLLA
jgi:predicted nucleic acid-binding protein